MRNNRLASMFSLCHNCGQPCYAQNYYCEDCANELFEAECGINEQLIEENKVLAKALELACANLYDINFQLYNTEMDFVDYFKQQAEKEMSNE